MSSVEIQRPPADVEALLLQVADVVNTTLDLDTILRRIAELVRRIMDYEIFAILLLNEKTQELRFRFAVGYQQEVVERMRIKVGQGVTGLAVQRRAPVLVNDVRKDSQYIEGNPHARSELAIPLIFKNRVIGVIDIEASQPDYFTPEHAQTLTLIASRIAIGIEHARLYTRVSRQAKTLQLLNEISREITSILNLDELLKRIAEDLSRLIDYQIFSILLIDDQGKQLEHRFSIRFKESINIKKQIPIGHGIVGYAAAHREPVLVPDVTKDPRYINVNPETRSELAVPLIYKGNVIGVLDLEHTRRRYFNEDHLRTLSTLAAQIAIAIENARLYEQVARQEQRLEHDLALARELQFRLLPAGYPRLRNAEVAAKFQPAQAIGGDLYDFVTYPITSQGCTSCTAVAIGDVSGKGPAAALYAALVSGILRSHAAERPGADEMLQRVNASLMERRVDTQYVTLLYTIWQDDQRVLKVANSGMPRPIYCHHGEVQRIEATGLPLGLFDKVDYDELSFQCEPGDVFLFFSDGISDAANPHGVLFGRGRVEEVVKSHCDDSASQIVQALFDAVCQHVAGAPQFDDQTVVALKVVDSAVAQSQ